MYLRVKRLISNRGFSFPRLRHSRKKNGTTTANGFEMTWSYKKAELHVLEKGHVVTPCCLKKAQNVPVSHWRATCAYQRSAYQSIWLQA